MSSNFKTQCQLGSGAPLRCPDRKARRRIGDSSGGNLRARAPPRRRRAGERRGRRRRENRRFRRLVIAPRIFGAAYRVRDSGGPRVSGSCCFGGDPAVMCGFFLEVGIRGGKLIWAGTNGLAGSGLRSLKDFVSVA